MSVYEGVEGGHLGMRRTWAKRIRVTQDKCPVTRFRLTKAFFNGIRSTQTPPAFPRSIRNAWRSMSNTPDGTPLRGIVVWCYRDCAGGLLHPFNGLPDTCDTSPVYQAYTPYNTPYMRISGYRIRIRADKYARISNSPARYTQGAYTQYAVYIRGYTIRADP